MQQRNAIPLLSSNNNKKSTSRYSYASDLKKHPEQSSLTKVQCKTIYSISFSQDALMITSKYGLVIYSLLTLKQIFSIQGQIWQASFIPQTNYIIYVINQPATMQDPQKQTKNAANIIDLVSSKIVSTIKVKFFIEYIKTGIHCIALASLQNICILSFPKLKPIYSGIGGNGLRIVFDISQRGVIFAHDTNNKGQLIIHNLTGPLNKLKFNNQRKDTVSSVWTETIMQKFKTTKSKVNYKNMLQYQQKRKFIVQQTFPSKQEISCIKISPTGGRVAVTNIKGSSIRIFLTNSGQLFQQFRVSYDICKILDLAFDQQGLFLACLTQNMYVYVFSSQIDQYDESFYKTKYKSHIYQEQNPSSSLWFLSLFYSPFGNDQPFCFYELNPPESLTDKDKQKQKQKQKARKQKQKQKSPLDIILEDQNSNPTQVQLLKRNLEANTYSQISFRRSTASKKNEKEVQFSEEQSIIMPQNNNNKLSLPSKSFNSQKSPSFARSSLPGTLLQGKRSTLQNEQQQKQKQSIEFIPTVYNTVNKIHIGANSQVWTVRGYFLYGAQYDRFNGGVMESTHTMIIQ